MAREKVSTIKIGSTVGDSFGWLHTKTGRTYIMWWALVWPEDMTAMQHVMHSHWISMLRDAIANDWEIEVKTDGATSNKVLNIKVYAP